MSRRILAIDVRHDAVSAIVLNSGLKENKIEGFAYAAIPPKNDSGEDSGSGLSAALKTIAEELSKDGAHCVAALPAESLSIRNLQIPFKGHKRIAQVLPFELEPLVPFPVENLVIDFQEAASLSENPGQTDIIAMAATKEDVGRLLEDFKSAGLDPQTVTVGSYPAAFWTGEDDRPDASSWILDVASRHAVLMGVSGNRVFFMRNMAFRGLAADPVEALASAVRQTLAAFDPVLARTVAADTLFLTGPALSEWGETPVTRLKNRLGFEKAVFLDIARNPLAKIKSAPTGDFSPHRCNGALALALAEAEGKPRPNFRKGLFAKKTRWTAHRDILIQCGVFAGLLLLLWGANLSVDTYFKEKKRLRMEEEIHRIFRSAFPDVTKVVDPVRQFQAAVREMKQEALFPMEGPSIRVIDILNELSTRIPEKKDVLFTRMVVDPEAINIAGDTDSFNSVDETQTQISSSGLFKKVTIISTEIDKNTNRVRFKIKIDL